MQKYALDISWINLPMWTAYKLSKGLDFHPIPKITVR